MKQQYFIFALAIIVIVACLQFTMTHAKLFSDKDVCVPYVSGFSKEGATCGDRLPACAPPTECETVSMTCKTQELYAGNTCAENKDCYAVQSSQSDKEAGLKCLSGKCRWIRGLGDSCELDAQCPSNMPCTGGVCTGLKTGDTCTENAGCAIGLICDTKTTMKCQPMGDIGAACETLLDCKSGMCLGDKCVAIQKSVGGDCTIANRDDNCGTDLYCDSTDNKCRSKAKKGEACDNTFSDPSKICASAYFCHQDKCVDTLPCTSQDDCTAPNAACMCSTKKCTANSDAQFCASQTTNIVLCLANNCRTSIKPYMFASPNGCELRKCNSEVTQFRDCIQSLSKAEYGVDVSFLGSTATVSQVSGFVVALCAIVALFCNLA